MNDISLILKALDFAASRHRAQFRKGPDRVPYINHPIQVANLLANRAGEKDPVLISAAILHDVIEDTVNSDEEKNELIAQIRKIFGEEVLSVTLEVTDDRNLDKRKRKLLQIEKAPFLSNKAKKLKIADKIMNLRDISVNPPEDWPLKRIIEYQNWAEKVVAGARGVSPVLESIFDETLKDGRIKYNNILIESKSIL